MRFYLGVNVIPVFVALLQISTRKAYGVALKRMGDASQRVVALDGDTKNSTFSDIFKKAHPERYIECFIAEQNMVLTKQSLLCLLLTLAKMLPIYFWMQCAI